MKVSDFGIVRDLEGTNAKASTFVGTLTYMSPERIAGEPYDAKVRDAEARAMGGWKGWNG